jgi:multiple sugar transport system permease protein
VPAPSSDPLPGGERVTPPLAAVPAAPPTRRRPPGQQPGRGRWTPFWFLAPAVATLLLVGIYPTIFAVITSLRQYNLTRAREGFPFVGFDNYISVLTDDTFQGALARTGTFFLTVMPAEILLGLLIALLLHQPGWTLMRSIARTSLVVPLATTYAVVGLLGRLIFNRDFGVANQFAGWLGIGPIDWLGSPSGAFAAIAIMDIWQWTPFCALIFLSGLSMVSPEIEEAAKLETRSFIRLALHVQLPYLLPGLTAMLILRSADVLKLFDMVFTMTRGGPGDATDLISIYIQRIGFRVFDLGTASAQAVILLVITVILARIYIRAFYREID